MVEDEVVDQMEPKTTKLRLMTKVLMEQRVSTTPTKRRKAKARRTGATMPIGNIMKYFIKVQPQQEWIPDETKEGGAVDGMRKRKCLDLLEDREQQLLTTKSRRLMVEDTETTYGTTNLRTLSPLHLLLGAKSGTWREETERRSLGVKTGLELRVSNEKEGGNLPGELDKLQTKSINSQIDV